MGLSIHEETQSYKISCYSPFKYLSVISLGRREYSHHCCVYLRRGRYGEPVYPHADPDPAFHLDADPDPAFRLDADPDSKLMFKKGF